MMSDELFTGTQKRTVGQLFEAKQRQNPDAIAVSFEATHLTYGELNRRANRLAHYLRTLGVGPEIPVGICMERSLELIIGLLGILKAGGAYLPLDPLSPPGRLAFLLDDAHAPLVLTQPHLCEKLAASGTQLIVLESDPHILDTQDESDPGCKVEGNQLAYIIYTSGSTGQPKGVMITHDSLLNFVDAALTRFELRPNDAVLQFSSVSFDTSVEEIYPCLLSGTRLVLRTEDMIETAADFLRQSSIWGTTVQSLPTAYWHELTRSIVEEGLTMPAALRLVALGGEQISSAILAAWYRHVDAGPALVNGYGPTECTVVATYQQLSEPDAQSLSVPIGQAIAHVEAYVLDAALQPVHAGQAGELYIAGRGLARGYLGRPEITAERFLPCPGSSEPGARLYRTGDLARQLPDGHLEFLGRADQQVKIRGYRVEPGEVEVLLRQHPDLEEAFVVAREQARSGDQASSPSDASQLHLVAYLRPRAGRKPERAELRQFLRDSLPEYMIPAVFLFVETFPLNQNGKVDRQALPAPDWSQVELDGTFAAPRTPAEAVLAGIWAEVLGLPVVSINANFFELGGHSLAAMRVIAAVRSTFQAELSFQRFFAAPTVAELAGQLTSEKEHETTRQRIPRLPRTGVFPLSYAQERVWFLQQLYPDILAYHTQTAHILSGQLDVAALERSINELTRRHEIFRTTFPVVDGTPVQMIHPPQPMPFPVIDLQGLDPAGREEQTQLLIAEALRRVFDLARLPLLRWILLRQESQKHVLLLIEHHLIHDGWSSNVLLAELLTLYRAFSTGQPSPLAELPVQFADFVVWQRDWMQGEAREKQLQYWRKQLERCPSKLNLPYDYPRPALQSFTGAAARVQLAPEISAALRALSRREGTTLFMTMLAAFMVLLARYSEQEDICVGTGIANRRLQESEALLGMIINNVVLRVKFADNPSFRSILKQVRQVTLDAYENQDVPFDQVVQAVQPQRDLSRNPLFQVMFGFHDAPMPSLDLPELSIRLDEALNNGSAKFDMNLTLIPRAEQYLGKYVQGQDDDFTIIWEYNTDLFAPDTIARMIEHYQQLLKEVADCPEKRIADVSFLTEREWQQIQAENRTGVAYSAAVRLHLLFEEQAKRAPDAIALVFQGQHLTYQELDRRTNQLAHFLRDQGIGPESPVGIFLERSPEMVIGLLGILKAGGVYVPLEPSDPVERVTFLLAETGIRFLLTAEPLVKRLPPYTGLLLLLDQEWSRVAEYSSLPVMSGAELDTLAYIIYTSGSTGHPKGVMCTHRNVCNRLLWGQATYPLTGSDRVLQKTPFNFDVSVWEFFWPLMAGSCLVLIPPGEHRSSASLARAIEEEQITAMHFVPSMLNVFLEHQDTSSCRSLRHVFCSGEALAFQTQERFFACMQAQLHSLYGPTETSIEVSFWEPDTSLWRPLAPIGRAISNSQLYVLDSQMRPLPAGVAGEIYIGGDGLARGYFHRPEQTAAAFLPNPFSTGSGERLYRSGDLGRYLPGGAIEFLGRVDQQVKIRGFRIEPGEIEAALNRYPAVQNCVVIAREDKQGERNLAAYIVPQAGVTPTTGALRRHLQHFLPEYMLPSTFLLLDALPLTANGKIDRKALPVSGDLRPELESAFVPPRTPAEQMLADIWTQLLGLKKVGIYDNFFELGGHSLLATQVLSRIRQALRVELPLRVLFEAATIATLVERLNEYEHKAGQIETVARLNQEVARMSTEEISRLLAQKKRARGR